MSGKHIWTSDRNILELGVQNYTCNWGTDVALIYEDEAEAINTLCGILHAGYVSANRQCCVMAESLETAFLGRYRDVYSAEVEALKDVKRFKFATQGRLKILFDPDDPMMTCDNIDSFYYETQIECQPEDQADVSTCVRCVMDARQILARNYTVKQFAELLFHTNIVICNKNWLHIVLYDLNYIPSHYLMKALCSHRFIIKGNKFIQNSLYKL